MQKDARRQTQAAIIEKTRRQKKWEAVVDTGRSNRDSELASMDHENYEKLPRKYDLAAAFRENKNIAVKHEVIR